MSLGKIAVCYLTRIPDPETLEFAEALSKDERISSSVDICIMVDDNNYSIPTHPSIKFIKVNNQESITNGYHSANKIVMNTDCISWDKALYYFCVLKRTEYSFVWLIEDDAFIPTVDAFVNLHSRYSKGDQGDLICQKNDENLNGDTTTWKWADVVGKFNTPWYHSMVCAIGCSRRLLDAIAYYVQQRRFLPFIEYMFNTIAMQSRLKVVNPPELSTIVYRENWTMDHIRQRPMNWFHPIKEFTTRRSYRSNLFQPSAPTQDLPSHYALHNIPSWNPNIPTQAIPSHYAQNYNPPWNPNVPTQGMPLGYDQQTFSSLNAAVPTFPVRIGHTPQYPYFMPPQYPTGTGNPSVFTSLPFQPNIPPQYPPH